MDNNDNRPLWLRPLVLAASTILYRSSKKEKQTTKITYDYKRF